MRAILLRFPSFFSARVLRAGAAFSGVLLLAALWQWTPLHDMVTPDRLTEWMKRIQATPWSYAVVLLAYLLGGIVFMPFTLLTVATAAAFTPVPATFLILTGGTLSACAGYVIGRLAGRKHRGKLPGKLYNKVRDYVHDGGVFGVIVAHMVPLGPYTAVNIALGILAPPVRPFLIGTVLGLVPGTLIKVVIGASLRDLLLSPAPKDVMIAVGAFLLWASLSLATHLMARHMQKKKRKKA